jgi:DNA repair photolyase
VTGSSPQDACTADGWQPRLYECTVIIVTDGLPPRRIKARGALSNPAGRFDRTAREAVDDGWYQDELPDSIATTVDPDRARSIVTRNDSPDVPFDQSINPYRGCEHGCVYCLSGDTAILMADGSTKALGDVRVGDEIYGTAKRGHYRRYTKTRVLAHWRARKTAHLVGTADGTALVASADHRFLTERGWKFVANGSIERPRLTLNNTLMGFGVIDAVADRGDSAEYRRGYLCGLIRGGDHIAVYRFAPMGRAHEDQYRFRLAMTDFEAVERAARYLRGFGVGTDRFVFQEELANRRRTEAIRTSACVSIEAIRRLLEWPDRYDCDWARGYAAGIFDAEGCFEGGIVKIVNTDPRIIDVARACLSARGFDSVVAERQANGERARPLLVLRIRGGLKESLRFFRWANPAISRKRSVAAQAVQSTTRLEVTTLEPLQFTQELFDITTGTGDFIANGVVSHNCYARPSHAHLGLSPGLDFETRLFYKAEAARLLEAELARPGYVCRPIMLGANTDPYQPVERRLRVTRGILGVLERTRHPVGVVTKGALIVRDLDLLGSLARTGLAGVMVSLTTLDAETKRTLEPRAASPAARLKVIRELASHGVPVGVLVAPLIPAVTDHELERILEAAREAGAESAGYVLLRLPYEVKTLFREWLVAHHPERARHVMSLLQSMRGGRDNDPRFGKRMRGEGQLAELFRKRFLVAARRVGLATGGRAPLDTTQFRPPRPAAPQIDLF